MHQNQFEKLLFNSIRLLPSLELIEQQIQALEDDYNTDKDLRHLASLLYAGQLVERAGLLYSLNEQTFCHFLANNKRSLQKPFDKHFDNENLQ